MKRLNNPSSGDTISEVLRSLRVHSSLYCHSELRAPWGFAVKKSEVAKFHIVTRGSCWLEVEGLSSPIRLDSGDLVILPNGHLHQIRDDLRSPDAKPCGFKNANALWRGGHLYRTNMRRVFD